LGELGGENALPPADRAQLEEVRASARIDWPKVRRLKDRWLRKAWARFVASGAAAGSQRSRDLAAFCERERDWLDDYTLFRALREADPDHSWRSWPEAMRGRAPPTLEEAKGRLAPLIGYFAYLQWLAHRQLERARAEAHSFGVLFAEDSADAWARQGELRFDATIGVPPDVYSETGQDWGLPVYRWEVMEERAFDWLRHRARRTAEIFDIARIDHVVGFYRTYVRPRGTGAPFFSPGDVRAQARQGEAVLDVFRSSGAYLVAEDLGTVPQFVRQSLARMAIPGYRVLRWEKGPDGAFHDPADWPALSVATTGTHDTTSMVSWWEELATAEREALCRLPALQSVGESREFSPAVHRGLLDVVYHSRSQFLALPFQDLFGLRDRLNVPGTVSSANWTFRLPWTLPQLSSDPSLRARAVSLRKMALDSGRA